MLVDELMVVELSDDFQSLFDSSYVVFEESITRNMTCLKPFDDAFLTVACSGDIVPTGYVTSSTLGERTLQLTITEYRQYNAEKR